MNNFIIKKVSDNDKNTVNEIVNIHLETFKGFFLTFMGSGFLKQMYISYTEHTESGILTAVDDNGGLLGFLAYSKNMSGLYKHMIRHHIVQFAWYSLLAFFRNPKIFVRLIRAFFKPSEAQRKEKYVELASIGVRPNVKCMGVGSALIDALKKENDFDVFEYITLETDAIDNDAANHFYRKNGFVLEREFVTHEGRKMFEYRFRGETESEKD